VARGIFGLVVLWGMPELGAYPHPAAVHTDALPDQPRAADLGYRGKDEQQDRTRHRHGADTTSPPPSGRRDNADTGSAAPKELPRGGLGIPHEY
jgi:hypothetical protein